jgi:pyruvate/2-oxoglutarate dehydrogenase complex dihydrolipoamide dehydrogenase (E3) component
MSVDFDLVVLGGGSAGYAGASTAARLGLKVAVIEGGEEVGGLCILRGCMPSKTLIESANRFLSIRRAKEFGLRAGEISIHGEEIIRRKRRLIGDFADYRRGQLEHGPFEFIRGLGRFLDANTIEVTCMEGPARMITARTFLVATGSRQHVVNIPGLEAVGFLDSDDVLESASIPGSVIILGGGPTALEFAHFYSGLGAAVTLIQRSPQVLKEMDEDVVKALVEALEERGVRFFCGTQIVRVEMEGDSKRVRFQHESQEKAVEAVEIVYALGRMPNIERLGLDGAGVKTCSSGLMVNARQQTNVSHIFAAGDAAGPYEIVHIAIQQAEVAARNAARLVAKGTEPLEETQYRLKLSAVFTQPQVAVVGFSEKELRAAGRHCRISRYAFADHGKALVIGEPEGFVKLMADAGSREILGAAAVGPHAAELIHEIAVAMYFHATAGDLARVPHYHPTLGEIWTYPAEELA